MHKFSEDVIRQCLPRVNVVFYWGQVNKEFQL
jgi:hypothetical protein